jgi:hypothetical protein
MTLRLSGVDFASGVLFANGVLLASGVRFTSGVCFANGVCFARVLMLPSFLLFFTGVFVIFVFLSFIFDSLLLPLVGDALIWCMTGAKLAPKHSFLQ